MTSASTPIDLKAIADGSHGPLTQYFQIALKQSEAMGVRLRIQRDFERLVQLNARHRENWGPLLPTIDPVHSELDPDHAFWAEGLDLSGETIAAYSMRLFYWPASTLGDEIKSLNVFYKDPAPHRAAGEFAKVPDSAIMQISGHTVCTGSYWVIPNYRGSGLSEIIVRIARAYACTHWPLEYFWSLTKPSVGGSFMRTFGIPHFDSGITLHFGTPDLPAMLLCQTREEALADIASAIQKATSKSPA